MISRVVIPFHPTSFIASDYNKTITYTRFVSSLGFQSTSNFYLKIGYLSFQYPMCLDIPEAEETACTSLSWFVNERGISNNYYCSMKSNKLIMKNINISPDYSKDAIFR